MRSEAEFRLATYGTLAPGRANHHQLAGLDGEWRQGSVRGRLLEEGWGAALGFPGLILDEDAEPIPVQVFLSPDLPEHWPRLDAFEGDGYRRVVVQVSTPQGMLDACIYVLASGGGAKSPQL